MKNKLQITILITILWFVNNHKAQAQNDSIKMYTFINYEENIITIPDKSPKFDSLIYKLKTNNRNKISIAHIGDSHIQADFFSGNFRIMLQKYFNNNVNDRGFIFPYKTAKTNNPLNYTVTTKGNWTACRNVEQKLQCELGTAGIAVITKDKSASINICIKDTLSNYLSDQIMVFHEIGEHYFLPEITYPKPIYSETFDSLKYTLFKFKQPTDSININIKQTSNLQEKFVLQGVNFTSDKNGIIYHTFGVNGATFKSYLKCKYFTKHLSVINPDLTIISLGTNDSYVYKLNTENLSVYIDKTISKIKQSAPNSAIMFTIPGDHLMHKNKNNPNILKCIKIIKQKAKQHNCGYWDFHYIMGGEGSVFAWRDTEMAHTDFLHLTRKGYECQANLFFSAFIRLYSGLIKKNK